MLHIYNQVQERLRMLGKDMEDKKITPELLGKYNDGDENYFGQDQHQSRHHERKDCKLEDIAIEDIEDETQKGKKKASVS